jgi:Mg-chelatase subunit ChlD
MTPSHGSILLCTIILPALHAQDLRSRDRVSNISVDADLVLINAFVTDRHGRAITGLDASSFRLFEDGQEQVVTHCVSEDAPVSVGFVLDTSGSMDSRVELLKRAATRFVQAANPADEFFVVEFEARPRVAVPFTTDTNQVLEAIGRIKAGGSTALLDAVLLAVATMHWATRPRRALLIVSDGMDNHSRYNEKETKRLVSENRFSNLRDRCLATSVRKSVRDSEARSVDTGMDVCTDRRSYFYGSKPEEASGSHGVDQPRDQA